MNLENIVQFLPAYPGKLYLKVKLQFFYQSNSTIIKKYSMCQVLPSEKLNIL